MQELEKILEEMREASVFAKNYDGSVAECVTIGAAERILRKHTKNDGWIPVEKELPPNAKQKGAFCPKYQVMTKYGVTEGWYNPDYESWFCLFWFVDNKFTKPYIDFEHGDVPKRVQIEKGIDIVLAWRPLPEPYRPEKGGRDRNEQKVEPGTEGSGSRIDPM